MRKKFFYGTLLLFTTIYVISFIDRQIIAVLGVPIRDSLGLTNLQLGLLYGPVFSFVYAFSGRPMGRLADRYSRRKMIDRKSTRLNSSHVAISYAVFCL